MRFTSPIAAARWLRANGYDFDADAGRWFGPDGHSCVIGRWSTTEWTLRSLR